MNNRILKLTAATGLSIGGLLGLACSFAPTDTLRCIAWTMDGISLIISCVLLTLYFYRRQSTIPSIGFLVFAVGEIFIVASTGLDIHDHVQTFAVGTGLWAIALLIISSQKVYPIIIRCTGLLAAILFSMTSVLIFTHHAIHALARPLPFFGYPFLVVTLLGWAFHLLKEKKNVLNPA